MKLDFRPVIYYVTFGQGVRLFNEYKPAEDFAKATNGIISQSTGVWDYEDNKQNEIATAISWCG